MKFYLVIRMLLVVGLGESWKYLSGYQCDTPFSEEAHWSINMGF